MLKTGICLPHKHHFGIHSYTVPVHVITPLNILAFKTLNPQNKSAEQQINIKEEWTIFLFQSSSCFIYTFSVTTKFLRILFEINTQTNFDHSPQFL